MASGGCDWCGYLFIVLPVMPSWPQLSGVNYGHLVTFDS